MADRCKAGADRWPHSGRAQGAQGCRGRRRGPVRRNSDPDGRGRGDLKMAITSANQLELLQTAEAVAREKMIDPALVIEAMEESLARAAKSRYGAEMDIRVSIDRKTGRAAFTRVRTVVDEDELENYQAEFTPEQAKAYFAPAAAGRDEFWLRDGARIDPAEAGAPQVGDEFHEAVPPVEMGRIAAQSAKQVILQKVREAERDRQY